MSRIKNYRNWPKKRSRIAKSAMCAKSAQAARKKCANGARPKTTKNEKKRENKKNGGAKSGGRSLQKRKAKKRLQLRGSKINKNEKF